jgi:autotransporter-associated beta strand protein
MRKFSIAVLIVSAAVCVTVIFFRRPAREAGLEKSPAPPTVSAEKNRVAAGAPAVSGTNAAVVSTVAPAPALQKRAWDGKFFSNLKKAADGSPIQFALTDGKSAGGVIGHTERTNGELIYVSGTLSTPEPGRFFFQKQTLPGKQGDFAGVVEFPGSKTAWRIEPGGPGGKSELVARRLDEVICYAMPPADAALLDTNLPEEIPPLRPDQVPDYVPYYNDGIISLQSLPGAVGVLYIDYRGGYTPTWGGITYAKPNVSNAQIKDVWKRVAEDYMPFKINVTTDIKVYQAAPENSRQRCVCTPTTTAAPGAGGVSYLNSWNSTGDTPNWSFYSSGKAAAEVIAHECGHALGLGHQGNSTSAYETGRSGPGTTGWAPIMGAGYYQPVTEWAKGEYLNANNTQDELNVIVTQNNNVAYRADDTGATLATARYLEIYSNYTAFAEGVIETTGDTDAFRFTTAGGAVSLTAYPVATNDWANLAVTATLADATDTIIASNNPQAVLTAGITTNLPAGTYTFRVTGAGRNDPLTNGFSNYASLGYYAVTGAVANATLPARFVIGENSTNGFLVGTISATNLGVDAVNFFIVSGNLSNTFALDDNGALTVANAATLDYETLALKTQSAVQFEMFVNITNTVNPSLTELNRRVVVQVTNVNEAPFISGFTNSLIARTLPGAVAGTVQVSDPDFYSVLVLAIVSGNSNAMFAIDSATGNVTVNGNLDPSAQGIYNLAIKVTDNGTPPLSATNFVQINVATNFTPFQPGTISYAIYDGIGSGVLVSNLTSNARFPADPTSERQITSAEGDPNRADSYGSVLRGFVIPPVSGSYNFYIATDDNGELWMSTTTNPASMTLIANLTGSGNAAASEQWNKYASQKSAARTLVAGQAYYLEARQKEGTGNDYLAVGWSGPATGNQTNVISGLYLAPYFVNYVPHLAGFTNVVHRDAFAGFPIGPVTVTDVNTNDLHSFSITGGNASGIFGVDSNGTVFVASDGALAISGPTNFTLSIRTTDSGTPALSATNTAKITIVPASVISLTQIQREMFNNLGSATTVASLTNNSRFPGQPDALVGLTNFASAANVGDNYGSRIRAYLIPSVTGDYQFFIASDDNSLLLFSRDTSAANAAAIASVSTGNGWVNQNAWSTYASQTSAVITNLIAGQRYYIEALQKEGGGGDHVEVGWLVPGSGVTNIIPGANLQALDLNYAPAIVSQTFSVVQNAANGAAVGTVAAQDSVLDALTFKIVGGNPNNTFAIVPASGAISVANNSLIVGGGVATFALSVAVQDSGYGGLYPLHSATNSALVTVIATNALLWDAGGIAGAQDGNGNWAASPANWWNGFTNGIWADNSLAVFGFGATTNCTVTITNDVTPAGIFFNPNNGGIYTVASSGGALNLSTPTVITANNDAVISASIKGGSLVKNGSAKLTLSNANTFTGGLTNNAGTLALAAASAASSNAITLNGGSLYNTAAMTIGNQININSNVSLYAAIAYNLNLTGALYGSGTLADNLPNQNASLTISGDLSHFSGTLLYADPDNTYNNVNIGSGATGANSMNTSGAKFVLSGGINLSRSLRVLGNSGATFRLGDLSGAGGTLGLSGTILSVGWLNLDSTFGGTINGTGGLTKVGSGTLTLMGTNIYTGAITVSGGQLFVNGVLTTNVTSAASVSASATLGGNGLICGPTTVQTGGVLAPGTNSIGQLTVSNNVTFSGGAIAMMEIAKTSGGLTNDLLFVSGTLAQNGSLVVTNLGTNALAAGDSFKLFNAATFTGAFTNLTLPPLAANLAWNTNTFATNGTLAVVVSLPFQFTGAAFDASGASFLLNGTGTAGQNYILQTATNLTAPVWLPILTNMADSYGLFQFTDPQTTNFLQRFYRVQGN